MVSEVIWPESPRYEEARIGRVFNHRRPNRYPCGVIEASCVQDVVDAVKLAKDMKLRVSVRSGGHSWAAWSVRDEYVNFLYPKLYLMIDFAPNITRDLIKHAQSPQFYGANIHMLTTYLEDSAILIALGNLKQLDLDEQNSIIKVSPSTTGRILNGYLATKGKMFGRGHCPDVGLGSFLLQGGMGWNCKVCELLLLFGASPIPTFS
jgi:FAD/FMN-containing dehydrogenase